MGILNWLTRRPAPEDDGPLPAPVLGISKEELAAALAAMDTLGMDVDRRILSVQVVGDGHLKVETGHCTGPLDAHVDHVVLRRGHSGWRAEYVGTLVS